MSLTENVNTELAKMQLLLERRVDSSWLEDIVYRGKHNTIFPGEELIFFKAKKNPKMYICRGLTHNDYVKWINADSKGKYFRQIQNDYDNTWFEYTPDFRIIKFDKITDPMRNKAWAKVKNQTWKLNKSEYRDKRHLVSKKKIKQYRKKYYDMMKKNK